MFTTMFTMLLIDVTKTSIGYVNDLQHNLQLSPTPSHYHQKARINWSNLFKLESVLNWKKRILGLLVPIVLVIPQNTYSVLINIYSWCELTWVFMYVSLILIAHFFKFGLALPCQEIILAHRVLYFDITGDDKYLCPWTFHQQVK